MYPLSEPGTNSMELIDRVINRIFDMRNVSVMRDLPKQCDSPTNLVEYPSTYSLGKGSEMKPPQKLLEFLMSEAGRVSYRRKGTGVYTPVVMVGGIHTRFYR